MNTDTGEGYICEQCYGSHSLVFRGTRAKCRCCGKRRICIWTTPANQDIMLPAKLLTNQTRIMPTKTTPRPKKATKKPKGQKKEAKSEGRERSLIGAPTLLRAESSRLEILKHAMPEAAQPLILAEIWAYNLAAAFLDSLDSLGAPERVVRYLPAQPATVPA